MKKSKSCWGFASEDTSKSLREQTKDEAEEWFVAKREEWFVDRGVCLLDAEIWKRMLNVALTSVHTRKTSCCVLRRQQHKSSACKQVFM